MTIYTIGFTKRSAKEFFETLRNSGVKHLLDIRLNNKSQLAGFAKKDDLRYFLKKLVKIEYHEMLVLAPEKSLLNKYRKTGDWVTYKREYLKLIKQRHAEKHIPSVLFEEGIVLLCSEAEPSHCHRRLAAEYLTQTEQTNTKIVHL